MTDANFTCSIAGTLAEDTLLAVLSALNSLFLKGHLGSILQHPLKANNDCYGLNVSNMKIISLAQV